MGQSQPSNLPNNDNSSGQTDVDKALIESDQGLTITNSPLEWKFNDFRKMESSPIFVVDPLILKKFIGHYVVVKSQTGERFTGCCLAIDPVSLSVILGNRIADGKIRIVTLPGYHLHKIFIKDLPETEANQEALVSVNDSDIAELFHAPSLYCESRSANVDTADDDDPEEKVNTEIPVVETKNSSNAPEIDKNIDEAQQVSQCPDPDIPTLTTEETAKKRVALEVLLKKQHMPFKVVGEVLEIIGGVKINPPYTIETCDTKGNKIIKKKLGEIIKLLDSKDAPQS
ncbi:unnamed protein product [Orchesella dallaii]|uniref:AD domain-containing protein n=1 Tax=Orchesella dallaii TaxID=48710 RepID=A0ABP1QUG3_9HEXA